MKRRRGKETSVNFAQPAAPDAAPNPATTSKLETLIAAALDEHPTAMARDLANHASPLTIGGGTADAMSVVNTNTAPARKPGRSRRAPATAAAAAKEAEPRRSRPPRTKAAIIDRAGVVQQPAPEAVAPERPAAMPQAANADAPVPAASPTVSPRVDVAPRAEAASSASRPATVPNDTAPLMAPAVPLPDMESLARNMGKYIEYSGKAAAAYLKPRESGAMKSASSEDVVSTMNSLGKIAESWMANPTRMLQAQAALSTQLFGLWADSFKPFMGGKDAEAPSIPRKSDKRFASPEWQSAPVFDFLHQAYLATTDWAKAMVADAEGVDETTREKAAFYLRQISSALSPSNFLATNPELLKETFKENGENLVRGMEMLAEDIEAGNGDLKIRQSDASKFKLGVDMASTPGKVVFRNDLMELLQYASSTPTVFRRPLLIVPPWINKFYVLDLNREKSFIRWAVAQGLTVFVISWVNPDERHAGKDWDAYMHEGIVAALDAIETATGETAVSTVGYCVGGTLLAATLAYMAGRGDKRITSSTFLTTQVDFREAGDLKVFADEAQIRVVEKQMTEDGYLPGTKMANAFNMLRPDDLIWSYSINTYLKGKSPAPFDLLAWNADSTRMSAANHAFYLRNCYLENRLTKGEMVIGGETVSLGAVTIPIYDLAAKEDHIAPARSVFTGSKSFGGPVRYVMAGSGHIAGVVNPPAKAKYQYWANGDTSGSFERWVETATETKGTWWLDWIAWIGAQAPERVPARIPGEGGLPALCDAPGEYVRVQS